MPTWKGGRRDLGDRARDLADRAGDALRRGFDRVRGDEDPWWRGSGRGDWRRTGEYGRWGGERYPRSDLGDQHRTPFIRNRDDRDLTYRGVPGGSVYGGVDEGGRDFGYGGEESGYGSVHYDRDFGYGAFGSLRDRGFEDRPYNEPGIHRFRPDQHPSREFEDYDRDMRGFSREGSWEGGWRGRPRGTPSSPGYRGRDWGGEPSGWPERGRWERDRWGGMTPGWRGRGGGMEEYGGYSRGLGEDPYFERDDFGGGRYDREFGRDREDWF